MARVLKTFEKDGLEDFCWSMSKVKHKAPCSVSPSIGFEFEIPVNEHALIDEGVFECWDDLCDFDYMIYNPTHDQEGKKIFCRNWLSDRGFIHHFECGGFEVGSPIHYNIMQARMTAKALLENARKVWWLSPDSQGEYTDTGIHVHAGLPSEDERDNHGYATNWNTVLAEIAYYTLNRESSSEFMTHLNRREERFSYYSQGEANKWDAPGYLSRERTRPHNFSVITNGNAISKTIEYRMFNGVGDRLLPAIEFSHAFTKFIHPLLDEGREFLRKLNVDHFEVCSPTAISSFVPYMSDFKSWLEKQPGYSILKAEPAMDYI